VFGFIDKGLFEQLKTFGCSGKILQELTFFVIDVEYVPYCHGTVSTWVGDARDSPHLRSVVVNVGVGCRKTNLNQERNFTYCICINTYTLHRVKTT
jgi:hypothetical protein